MADTPRTESYLLTDVFQDGQAPNSITAQDMRDLIVSAKTFNPELIPQTGPGHQEGLVFYDSNTKTLSYYNENTDVTVNIGQEMILRVYNDTVSTITDGTVVYISGATGNLPTVEPAIASNNTPIILGVATADILAAGIGYITVFGVVHGFDTRSYAPGDNLFVSSSVAGAYQTTRPVLPIETIRIAIVLDSQEDGHLLITPERENHSNQTTVFASASHSATQTAETINTATPVKFDTNNFIENLTHSTTVNNSEFTIDISGVYSISVGLQLAHTGGGSSTIHAWMQVDTGSGFVDVPNSGVTQDLSNNDTRVLVLNGIGRWDVGNIGRVMWYTTNLAGQLVAAPASVSPARPAVPSVIMTVQKVGIA